MSLLQNFPGRRTGGPAGILARKQILLLIAAAGLILLAAAAALALISSRSNSSAAGAYFPTGTAGLEEAQDPQTVRLKQGDSYDIVAKPVKRTIDGRSVRMLGYNGMVPGPIIEVNQGGTVTLNVKNELGIDTTLHPHGINADNRSDGLPGITQPAIKPGQTYRQTIQFPDAGVYWYHPHIREDYTQASGLYANFLVRPRISDSWPKVSSEKVLTLSDIALDDKGIKPFSTGKVDHTLMGRFGTVQLINGRQDYRQTVSQGDVVRYYLTNTASVQLFRFAIPGAKMKLIGADNGLYEQEKLVDNVTIAPAERVIVDVYFPDSRQYAVQNATPLQTYELGAIEAHSAQSVDQIVVNRFNTEQVHPAVTESMAPTLAQLDSAVKKRLAIKLNMDMALMHSSGGMNMDGVSQPQDTSDGIEWSDTMAAMNANSNTDNVKWQLADLDTGKTDFDWTFKKGTLVNLTINNKTTTMHPMQHPIHIHGQKFLVTSIDGVPQQNLVWKDTALIPAGKTFTLAVVFDNPGKWMIHCHIPEHLEAGMMGKFTVTEQ